MHNLQQNTNFLSNKKRRQQHESHKTIMPLSLNYELLKLKLVLHWFTVKSWYISDALPYYLTLSNVFGNRDLWRMNVERKRGTYDVTLTSLTGTCPISTLQLVKLTSYVQRLCSMFVSPKVPILFSLRQVLCTINA